MEYDQMSLVEYIELFTGEPVKKKNKTHKSQWRVNANQQAPFGAKPVVLTVTFSC